MTNTFWKDFERFFKRFESICIAEGARKSFLTPIYNTLPHNTPSEFIVTPQ